MVSKTPLKRKPKKEVTDDSVDFILGAEASQEETKPEMMPWEDESLRDDVVKLYNLRLPEPVYVKLKWLAENSPDSMHTIAMQGVLKEMERRLKER